MHIPDGHTEQSVLDDINGVLNGLVRDFRFGYYDEDDLRQEGFIFAHEALPRFDPTKDCALRSFLWTHIRNRFVNLRRNKLHRNSVPCLNCQNQCADISNNTCSNFDDISECPKWSGWNSRNQAKRNLMESYDASNTSTNTIGMQPSNDMDICTSLSRTELLQYVSEQIPLALRADYCRVLEGARLTKARRDIVVAAVKTIIGELLNENDFETWAD